MSNRIITSSIDDFFTKSEKWEREFRRLREIICSFNLKEELKWGKPCYTYEGNNILLIHGFKKYCAILFIKGSLIKDERRILIQQTEKVQAGRQMRFTNLNEINDMEEIIKLYINQAIEIEKSGKHVIYKKTSEYPFPDELKKIFDENPNLKSAFKNLTPGRQRGYLHYFNSAKQSQTFVSRIIKYTQKIIEGKGLND